MLTTEVSVKQYVNGGKIIILGCVKQYVNEGKRIRL